jgi:hypothetical protein
MLTIEPVKVLRRNQTYADTQIVFTIVYFEDTIPGSRDLLFALYMITSGGDWCYYKAAG